MSERRIKFCTKASSFFSHLYSPDINKFSILLITFFLVSVNRFPNCNFCIDVFRLYLVYYHYLLVILVHFIEFSNNEFSTNTSLSLKALLSRIFRDITFYVTISTVAGLNLSTCFDKDCMSLCRNSLFTHEGTQNAI